MQALKCCCPVTAEAGIACQLRIMKKTILVFALLLLAATGFAQFPLYLFQQGIDTRWASPENRNGTKGAAARENNGAKGHPFDSIGAGKTYTLLNTKGQGVVNRIWLTIRDRSPEMLRGLWLEMYWDGSEKPAVSAPLGDFFNMALGEPQVFENAFFANPEGRSFQCFIPMPFRTAARIQIVNKTAAVQSHIFFDVDYQLVDHWNFDWMYFHAWWQENAATTPGVDYELLPGVSGRGRYLGTHVGIQVNPVYGKNTGWVEGEVKIYKDGDKEWPTLSSTGAEDYIGSAWGMGRFVGRYSGCLLVDTARNWYSFYRYHLPDPVYFSKNCRITWQVIGGAPMAEVRDMQAKKLPLIPVGMDDGKRLVPLYEKGKVTDLNTVHVDAWVNFYRSDAVSSVTYFYLDKP